MDTTEQPAHQNGTNGTTPSTTNAAPRRRSFADKVGQMKKYSEIQNPQGLLLDSGKNFLGSGATNILAQQSSPSPPVNHRTEYTDEEEPVDDVIIKDVEQPGLNIELSNAGPGTKFMEQVFAKRNSMRKKKENVQVSFNTVREVYKVAEIEKLYLDIDRLTLDRQELMTRFEKLTMDMEMFKEARRQTLMGAAKDIAELKRQLNEAKAKTSDNSDKQREEMYEETIKTLREQIRETERQRKPEAYPYKNLFFVQWLLIVIIIAVFMFRNDFSVEEERQFS